MSVLSKRVQVNLENVFIPPGVSISGDRAFAYSGLTNVTISYGVNYIGVEAFNGCLKRWQISLFQKVSQISIGLLLTTLVSLAL